MWSIKSPAIGTLITLLSGALSTTAWAKDVQKNTTGLPTYPNVTDGTMDSVVRSLPNGQHCTHYSASTSDPLASVIDWYKKALPNAQAQDVNKDSLYGNYFKLDGITLLQGHDIVNVYRLQKTDSSSVLMQRAHTNSTSIEIFKCNDTPQAKERS